MEDKRWWMSRGVWGGIVAAAAGIAGAVWGVTLTADEQAHMVDLIVPLASAGSAVAGGIAAIVGRVRAKKRIGGKSNA